MQNSKIYKPSKLQKIFQTVMFLIAVSFIYGLLSAIGNLELLTILIGIPLLVNLMNMFSVKISIHNQGINYSSIFKKWHLEWRNLTEWKIHDNKSELFIVFIDHTGAKYGIMHPNRLGINDMKEFRKHIKRSIKSNTQ